MFGGSFSYFVNMSLFITSLNSGSNGNCYYVGNQNESVLIDVGISCRETEKRMNRLGLPMNTIKAIFITHEHSDHIKGVQILSEKYQLPVYITDTTLQNSPIKIDPLLVNSFVPYQSIQIGDLSVKAFPKRHDACDAHSFTVSGNGVTIGIMTDIGSICEHVIANFNQCNAVILEANYDEIMLEEGRYPYFLKKRIRGGMGHLSNRQALELFLNHKNPNLSQLILAHLSKDNNCPEKVGRLFKEHAGATEIVVASRYEESRVFQIQPLGRRINSVWSTAVKAQQLTIF